MKIRKSVEKMILAIFCIFFMQSSNVQAALQSNGSTPATQNRDTWMVEVRKMESLGGTLGLLEDQNVDLTSNESNNIDIHMQKNTEYGAMALLSASSYGKPDKIGDGETTTGNVTGILIPYNTEWVAAQWQGYTDRIPNVSYNTKYINYYTNSQTSFIGDAFTETSNWHSTSNHGALAWKNNTIKQNSGGGWETPTGGTNYTIPGYFVRNNSNGIFSWNNCFAHSTGYNGVYYYYWFALDIQKSNSYASRAVIVNGTGL